jgi:hypothetical protein
MVLIFLVLPRIYFPLLKLLILVVVLSLMLILVDRCTKALVGAGARHRNSPDLWDLNWLCVPSADTTTATSSHTLVASTSAFALFQQWHHRLGHICGSHLSSLVHQGLLGHVAGDVLLKF